MILGAEHNAVASSPHGQIHTRWDQGFRFDYLVAPTKAPSGPVAVFFNGAVDRTKSPSGVVFQRSSWARDVPANCIFASDSTLAHRIGTSLSWAQGSHDVDYLELMAGHLIDLVKSQGWSTERLLLYGSSAGGFQALQIGARLVSARVLVNNPQTDWHRYGIRHAVRTANRLAYDTEDLDSTRKQFASRISVAAAYERLDTGPEVVYLLNAASRDDFNEQFLPFASAYSEGRFSLRSFEAHLYHSEAGHNPLPKARTLVELDAQLRVL